MTRDVGESMVSGDKEMDGCGRGGKRAGEHVTMNLKQMHGYVQP